MATKQIKIAVSIDAHGNWSAFGGSSLKDKDAADFSSDALDGNSQTYWITADIELPQIIEVPASGVTVA